MMRIKLLFSHTSYCPMGLFNTKVLSAHTRTRKPPDTSCRNSIWQPGIVSVPHAVLYPACSSLIVMVFFPTDSDILVILCVWRYMLEQKLIT